MVDWNEMVVFVRVVEEGSFVGAAKALGLPKSTVSRKVARLEERLGSRLLHRTTRVVRPTASGRAYFQRCQNLVADAEEAARLVTSAQEHPTGLLRITTSVLTAQRFLSPLIMEYLQKYPEVRMELFLTNRFVDLVDEGFDLAIRAGTLPESDLVARRLGPARAILVASPEYLRRRGTPRQLEDLREHDCIVAGTGPKGSWAFGGQRISVDGRFVVNDMTLARVGAMGHMGIARVPTFLVGEELENGSLVRVLEQLPDDLGGVYAVYPSRKHLSTAVRSFVDFLIERLEIEPPWYDEEGVG